MGTIINKTEIDINIENQNTSEKLAGITGDGESQHEQEKSRMWRC